MFYEQVCYFYKRKSLPCSVRYAAFPYARLQLFPDAFPVVFVFCSHCQFAFQGNPHPIENQNISVAKVWQLTVEVYFNLGSLLLLH